MPPPVALETPSGVMLLFLREKFSEARMDLLDLSSAGPFVAGQKKGPSQRKGEVNELAEGS